jgi:hypothetical protein
MNFFWIHYFCFPHLHFPVGVQWHVWFDLIYSSIDFTYSNYCCYCKNIKCSILLISCGQKIHFADYPYILIFSALLDVSCAHKIAHNTIFQSSLKGVWGMISVLQLYLWLLSIFVSTRIMIVYIIYCTAVRENVY